MKSYTGLLPLPLVTIRFDPKPIRIRNFRILI